MMRTLRLFAPFCLLLTTDRAWAAAAGPTRISLLQIIREGIEVPTYLIVAGSIVAITLIVEHFVAVRQPAIAPPKEVKRVRERIERREFRACLDGLRTSPTFFAQVMTAAMQHARHGFEAMHEAALEKSHALSARMYRKAEYLNILGNLGPLLGLFGTVWGMIEAFGSLSAGGGQAGAGELAGGISKALVNTLLGLGLAIVGIGFFGLCRNRIESLTVAATTDVLDLLEYFRPAANAPSPSSPSPSSPSPATPSTAAPLPATPSPTTPLTPPPSPASFVSPARRG